MVVYYSEFDTTINKKYQYDLDSKEGPPVPASISKKYKKEWSELGIQAKKSRVDAYAKHMMGKEPMKAATSILSLGNKVPTVDELTCLLMNTLKVVEKEGHEVNKINADVKKIDNVVVQLTGAHNGLAAKHQAHSVRIDRLEKIVGGKGAAPKRRTRKRVAFNEEE